MKHHVTLLRRFRLYIRQALPSLEVFRSDKTGLGNRTGSIKWSCLRVFALRAVNAIDPSVFMKNQTHIVHIRLDCIDIFPCQRSINKAEVIDSVVAYGQSEDGFTIETFGSDHQVVFTAEVNSARIKCSVNSESFHEMRIGLCIQIKSPMNRNMMTGNYRVLITVIYAVVEILVQFVFASDQLFLFGKNLFIFGMYHFISSPFP
ncbi:hypothetical protein D3C81_832350 [compost metagenome]